MRKMKWIPALFLVYLLGANITKAQVLSNQVDFFHGNWQEALNKAKAEKKLIFIDSYTVWCGPCKVFSAQTLTNPEVIAHLNSNFINLKVDIEKGEGPSIASKYGIIQIPTLLFVDGTGKVLSKKLGAIPTADFLLWGKEMSQFKQ